MAHAKKKDKKMPLGANPVIFKFGLEIFEFSNVLGLNLRFFGLVIRFVTE